MKEIKKTLKYFTISISIIIGIISVYFCAFIFSCYKDSMKINVAISSAENNIILDNENNKLFDNVIDYVNINEINENTKNAFISIEDKDFYNHNGINKKRIIKASLNNIKNMKFVEGASTITQQLIKNKYLSQEKKLKRKMIEIFLAKKLEKNYSKEEILENYLNIIYFGNNCYGIGDASKFYFDKKPCELTINESAILASIIKSPNSYSPTSNKENCVKRKNLVLKEMYNDNKINRDEYELAIQSDLNISNTQNKNNKCYGYLKDYILSETAKILNISLDELNKKNFIIKSTIDDGIQSKLIDELNNEENFSKNTYGNIADALAIVIDNSSNKILAYASKSDRNIYEIKRQPGSAIKPILVYSPAFEIGYNPASIIKDEPININGYEPRNLGGQNYGNVSINYAVAKSLNIPAVKIMQSVGIEKCKDYAKKLGIEFDTSDNNYAIALGGFTNGITLQSLTNAYTTYPENGYFKDSYIIDEIRTQSGLLLYKNQTEKEKIINDDVAYLTTSTLINSVKNGTSKKLKNNNYEIAGKTGTVCVKNSNLNTDCYSIAYTSNLTMGVWLGNTTNKKEYMLEGSNNGGTFATQIIKNIFEKVYENVQPENFGIPDSVIKCKINDYDYEYNNIILLDEDNENKNEYYFSKRFLPEKKTNIDLKIDDLCEINISDNEVILNYNYNKLFSQVNFLLIDENNNIVYPDINKNIFTFKNLSYDTKYNIFVNYIDKNDNKYKESVIKSIYIKNKKWYIN